MNRYVGTFGIGHELGQRYQPISAPGLIEAQRAMRSVYGTDYAFLYTQEQFNQSKSNGYFKNLRPLQTLFSEEVV